MKINTQNKKKKKTQNGKPKMQLEIIVYTGRKVE